MNSPALHHALAQTHVQELHRSHRAWSPRPITTKNRTPIQQRHRLELSAYLSRAIERLVGHAPPEAFV